MKILVSGATGLIGSSLVLFLKQWGYKLFRLTHRPNKVDQDTFYWNPERREANTAQWEGFHAVIHLAGENIAAHRWTPAVKQKILESRVKSTQFLCETLLLLKKPPKLLISASATGYYGNRGEVELDETSSPGNDFLADVCRAWEAATTPVRRRGIRVVHPRIGMVLSSQGGALKKMLLPFRLGLGGVIGSGEQRVSWIDIDDVCRAMHHVISTPSLEGAVNFTAPHPVSNRDFTQSLGRRLHRPTFLPMPAFLARFLFGEMADALLLSGASVLPKRLLQSGFTFLYPDLQSSLQHLI